MVVLVIYHQDKMVKKLYTALTAAPVPLGVITHYMRPVHRAPRIVSAGTMNKLSTINDLPLSCNFESSAHSFSKNKRIVIFLILVTLAHYDLIYGLG